MTRSGCGSPSGSVAGSAGGVFLCMALYAACNVAHLSASGSDAFYFICVRVRHAMCFCVWDEARHGTGFV